MIRYAINEDKGFVTAYFSEDARDHMFNLFAEIDRVFSDYNHSVQKGHRHIDIGICSGLKLPQKVMKGFEKFVGRAKCHPDDKFDVEKGKLVARDRLLYKWRKYKDRVLLQVIKELDGAHATIKNNLVKKIYFKCELLEDI